MKYMTVFIIPFAGGSSFSFKQWIGKSDFFNFVPLDLPGKGRRNKEPLAASMSEIINDIIRQINDYLNQNNIETYAIWGHSMGGRIAYEVALCIIQKNLKKLEFIVLSGTPAPTYDNRAMLSEIISDEKLFIDYLDSFGMINAKYIIRPEFKRIFTAVLNDYKILSEYKASRGIIRGVKGVIVYGESDDSFEMDWMEWKKYFSINPLFLRYPGKHFFIFEAFPEIVEDIKYMLKQKE